MWLAQSDCSTYTCALVVQGTECALVMLQDMACETFLKICHKCKRKFVVIQVRSADKNPAC